MSLSEPDRKPLRKELSLGEPVDVMMENSSVTEAVALGLYAFIERILEPDAPEESVCAAKEDWLGAAPKSASID